jgi:formylglycine-generating enzyme required for sulfatase activity
LQPQLRIWQHAGVQDPAASISRVLTRATGGLSGSGLLIHPVHLIVLILALLLAVVLAVALAQTPGGLAERDLGLHLEAIAALAHPSTVVRVPEGWFLMGTVRKDDDPYGLETQFDNTEYPQRRIWLDAYQIDRDEVSMAEYLAFLNAHDQEPRKSSHASSGTSSRSTHSPIM